MNTGVQLFTINEIEVMLSKHDEKSLAMAIQLKQKEQHVLLLEQLLEQNCCSNSLMATQPWPLQFPKICVAVETSSQTTIASLAQFQQSLNDQQ